MSNETIESFMQEVRSHPAFKMFVEEHLLGGIPELPEYSRDIHSGMDNTEQWKEITAYRRGYQAALTILGVYDSDA